MFSKKQKVIFEVVSVDSYNSIYYKFQNRKIYRIDKLNFDKKNFVVSTLNAKDFISATIEIGTDILDEDLQNVIELKTYEDLGLDQTIVYIVCFEEILERKSEKSRYFNVFVSEPKTIEDIFKSTKKQVKFIDAIYPKPYLIQNLYEKNIFDSFGVHGFLYFQREDAFVALFKNGKYLYSKSIKYSIDNLYEYFCKAYGKRVDEDIFLKKILKNGLNSSGIDCQNHLKELFAEVFSHINDIFLYAKRAYEIESIDLFFVGSIFGNLKGLSEYAHSYFGINTLDFNFEYNIKKRDNEYIDPFCYLSYIEAQKSIQKTSTAPNFTLFFRPPLFVMRRSGKFLITLFVSTILALYIPAYNYIYDYFIKMDNKLLQNETNKIAKLSNAIYSEIEKLEKSKNRIKAKIALEDNLLKKKREILQAVYEKKVNYLMKAKTLAKLGNDMSKFGIYVTKIINQDNQFILSLYAVNEKNITNFIKYLTNHYDKIVYTNIEKIYKDEKSGIYRGDLKVRLL